VGRAVRGGDPVDISRSRALPIALDRSAQAHLLLGDETSIASADALIRALQVEAVVVACFEVASMDYRWPKPELARPENIRWVDRAGRPGSALVSWLARQSLPSTNSTTAYVTGEAWFCATVYAHRARSRLSRGRRPCHAVLEDQVQTAVTASRSSARLVGEGSNFPTTQRIKTSAVRSSVISMP
jgi:NADPH-dependent ferric siderophore reductase